LSAPITRLGMPNEERLIAGQKVFIWSTSELYKGTLEKCQIRAIMKGEVIGSFDFEGDEFKCRQYAVMLHQTSQ
jgi:hypothetical protein